MPRDLRDVDAFLDDQDFKRYKKDEKRKRDDKPKIDDEEAWGPWTGEGIRGEVEDKTEIIDLWVWKENGNGNMVQNIYKHNLAKKPLTPTQIKQFRPETPQEPQMTSDEYVELDSRNTLDQPHAMEATAKACGNKPRGTAGVSIENDGTKMHGVADFASGAPREYPPYFPPQPPPNPRPPQITRMNGYAAWHMQKASSPAVARFAAMPCAAAFPPGPGGYNKPTKSKDHANYATDAPNPATKDDRSLETPRTPDESIEEQTLRFFDYASALGVKQGEEKWPLWAKHVDTWPVWAKRVAYSPGLADTHGDCDRCLIEDPEDPEDQCELVWLRLVSLQQAVTTASIRRARCACMCAHVCMRNWMASLIFGTLVRSLKSRGSCAWPSTAKLNLLTRSVKWRRWRVKMCLRVRNLSKTSRTCMHGLVYTNVRLQPHPSFIWSSAGGVGYSSTDTAMQDTLRDIITSYVGTSATKAEASSGAAG